MIIMQKYGKFRVGRRVKRAFLLLLVLFPNCGRSEDSLPRALTAVYATFYPSTPAALGEEVGLLSAKSAPTSWTIIDGDPDRDFAISNTGMITFTAMGAAHFDGSIPRKRASLTIQASSGAGSETVTIAIDAYADGSRRAPIGSAQYPGLLASYRARPPWKVAGFDYYVGIPLGTNLSPPSSISNPNMSVSDNAVVCGGNGASVSLSGIDFKGVAIYVPSGGCSSLTIANSNFGCIGGKSPGFAFVQDQNNARLVIRSSKINSGDDCGSWPNNVSDPIACGGQCTIEYNWFYHPSERILSIAAETVYRWNLIDNPNTSERAHENYHQFGGGATANSDLVEFNASYNAIAGKGEGYQFYGNVVPATIVSPKFRFNTMIAKKFGGHITMSYMVHGSCQTYATNCTTISGTGVIEDNYFDPSGAYGVFYGGTLTPSLGWFSNHNVNMLTGRAVSPR